MRQQIFKANGFKIKKAFGGSLLKKANARSARPIDTKRAMHIVLRSSQARGSWSFMKYKNFIGIEEIVRRHAKSFGITIYEFGQVGNHLHILLRVKSRFTLAPFMRAIAGHIAIFVTGCAKTRELEKKFWDYRPFSRIVEWWKGYKFAKDYVARNELEALGVIDYKPRKSKPNSSA